MVLCTCNWYYLPELISCPVFGWTSFSEVSRHSSSEGVWPLPLACDLRKLAIAASENHKYEVNLKQQK